nr:hypothetical protein [Tanacetum cinerariifolium]
MMHPEFAQHSNLKLKFSDIRLQCLYDVDEDIHPRFLLELFSSDEILRDEERSDHIVLTLKLLINRKSRNNNALRTLVENKKISEVLLQQPVPFAAAGSICSKPVPLEPKEPAAPILQKAFPHFGVSFSRPMRDKESASWVKGTGSHGVLGEVNGTVQVDAGVLDGRMGKMGKRREIRLLGS